MVIFFENGRLGNQLFQLAAIKFLFPRDKLVLFGFSQLSSLFEIDDVFFPCSNSSKRIYYYLRRLSRVTLNIASIYLRVISCYEEHLHDDEPSVTKRTGLVTSVKYVRDGFFQSNEYINSETIKFLRVRQAVSDQAYSLINKYGDKELVFVHVRRGDYLEWPSKKNSAAMSNEWYFKAMDMICSEIKNVHFLIFSDDIENINNNFSHIKNSTIMNYGEQIDFAIMSLCRNGILSASSFSWWAACLANNRFADGIYYAPKYWVGNKISKWIPTEKIKSEWIRYI